MSLSQKQAGARARVRKTLVTHGAESYVAYSPTSGQEWSFVGHPNHVVPQPDLVAAWSHPGADITYHHAHPDDRALSPSDLGTLYNSGVVEVWAHCRSGISYCARRPTSVGAQIFKEAHDRLNNTMSQDMARDFIEHATSLNALSAATYETLSDRAFCEALDRYGVMSFQALDDQGAPLPAPCDLSFPHLVAVARAVLDGRWPPAPITS